MNQSTTMLRLAAATLAATLATTVMADNGKPSSASNRSNDSGARHLEYQGPQTGGKLKPGHPAVTIKGRPVTSNGKKNAPAFEADRAGRQNDALNELEYLDIIRCAWEDPFGFSSDDLDADRPGRQYGDISWAQTDEWTADDLDADRPGRQNDDPRWVQTEDADEEEAKWESDDLSSDHADARSLQHDPMDIDYNGIVDMQDFGLLIAAFGTAEHDLNGDDLVDGQDLGLILARMTPLVAVD